jgi:neutral ceramidase
MTNSQNHMTRPDLRRRAFLAGTLGTGICGASLGILPSVYAVEANGGTFSVGEGVVDTTPPLGIEMGGFHRLPGNERRVEGVRQPTAARALVLQLGDVQMALISLDLAGASDEVARRIQQQVAVATQIPAANVRVCSTHTHSMPAFLYLRQWGAIPTDYMSTVENKAVEAVKLAQADLAPAKLLMGKSRAVGGNFNRTTKDFKSDNMFGSDSTDSQRWLDTMLRVLYFERGGDKLNLLWYHFSAHPVCYADDQAGPDWPGLVRQRVIESLHIAPSFLQGHAGDVNPGAGEPWRGDAEQTAQAVHAAIEEAMRNLKEVPVTTLRMQTTSHGVALDLEMFNTWLQRYHDNPALCASNDWVDAGFAKEWYESNVNRPSDRKKLPVMISAMQIGDVGLAFHPSELYSYYGLAIQRSSPLPETIVVGYTDGLIGYLTDPAAYRNGEYAALTVPKILDFPPFTPTAAAQLTAAIEQLIERTVV